METDERIVYVNEELVSHFGPHTELGEVISRLESQTWQKGRVITEVRVNGMYMSEHDEKRLSSATVEEIKTLEVKVADPHKLANESVLSAVDRIPKIIEGSLQVADLLRLGRLNEGQKILKDLFSACQWLSDVLALVKKSIFERIQDSEFKKRWLEAESQYASHVFELLNAFERGDYVVVADVLEYEITTVMDKWLELLRTSNNISL